MISLKLTHEIILDPMRISKETGEGLESVFRNFLSEKPRLTSVHISNVESQKLVKVEIKNENSE